MLLDDAEYGQIERMARRERTTVSDWVRRALRQAADAQPTVDAGRKLAVVRAAVRHEFPTADIEQMIREIEQGYTHE